MYRYEDLMLDDLLEDPSFDEDDPEVLYALARCYLEGKGVAADEAIYRKFLKKAAEAGSKTARLELEAAAPAQPDEPKEAGYGCTASESDSRAMILLAAQRGPARLKYDTALDILDSTPGEALLLLDKAQEELESDGGNEPLLRRVRLHLAALKNGGCLPEEMVSAALAETEDPSVTSLLLATFTRQPRSSPRPYPPS